MPRVVLVSLGLFQDDRHPEITITLGHSAACASESNLRRRASI